MTAWTESSKFIGTTPTRINKRAPALLLALFFAPQTVEMLNLWNDFRKVVDFIDENRDWLSRYLTE